MSLTLTFHPITEHISNKLIEYTINLIIEIATKRSDFISNFLSIFKFL
jgi:hypothetical protein